MAKKKKKAKAKSKPTGKDTFGTRIGSLRAKVNEGLSKTPQTLAKIKAKQGLKTTNTFGDHLQCLIAAKLIKKVVGSKYVLTDKGAKIKKGK